MCWGGPAWGRRIQMEQRRSAMSVVVFNLPGAAVKLQCVPPRKKHPSLSSRKTHNAQPSKRLVFPCSPQPGLGDPRSSVRKSSLPFLAAGRSWGEMDRNGLAISEEGVERPGGKQGVSRNSGQEAKGAALGQSIHLWPLVVLVVERGRHSTPETTPFRSPKASWIPPTLV